MNTTYTVIVAHKQPPYNIMELAHFPTEQKARAYCQRMKKECKSHENFTYVKTEIPPAFYIIELAYPTSPHAKKYGYYNTGCYTVELCPDEGMSGWNVDKAFPTIEEARTYAATLALPPHPLAVKYNHM